MPIPTDPPLTAGRKRPASESSQPGRVKIRRTGAVQPGPESRVTIPHDLHLFITGELTESFLHHVQIWANAQQTEGYSTHVWWDQQSRLSDRFYQAAVQEILSWDWNGAVPGPKEFVPAIEGMMRWVTGYPSSDISGEGYEAKLTEFLARAYDEGISSESGNDIQTFIDRQNSLHTQLGELGVIVHNPYELEGADPAFFRFYKESLYSQGNRIRANDLVRLMVMRDYGGVAVDWNLLPKLNNAVFSDRLPPISKRQEYLERFGSVQEALAVSLGLTEENVFLEALAKHPDGTLDPEGLARASQIRADIQRAQEQGVMLFLPLELPSGATGKRAVVLGESPAVRVRKTGFIVATPRNGNVVKDAVSFVAETLNAESSLRSVRARQGIESSEEAEGVVAVRETAFKKRYGSEDEKTAERTRYAEAFKRASSAYFSRKETGELTGLAQWQRSGRYKNFRTAIN